MADMIKFYKGAVASLPTTGVNGALYITTDEGAIYLGTGTGMKRLGDFVQVDSVANLPAQAHESCLYYCVAENILAKWNGTEWKQINKQPTAEEMKTLLGLGALAYLSEVTEDNLDTALKEKVNAAAEGNHAHLNKDELDKIVDGDVEKWNNKVDKETGKSLVDDAEITKLVGVSEGANKVEASTNGKIKIDGVDTTVYTHPDKHAIADVDGLQDALDDKVAKDGNKVLTTNDLTDELKGQYDAAYAHSQVAHAPADAQANIIEAVKVNGTALTVTDKAVDITVPTGALAGKDKVAKDDLDDTLKTELDGKVGSVTAGDASVTVGGTATAPTVAAKLSADADNALTLADDGLKVVIPAAAEYSIVKAADSGDYAAVYNLTKGGVIVGDSINIPKDMVVKSGSVVDDEIVLVLNDEAATEIKIPVASLIEYVTSGSATGDMVVVNVSDDHKVTATITDGTITLAKLDTDTQTKINKAHSHENADVLGGITADKVEAWDKAEQNAKDYADGLASNYAEAEHDHVAADITDFATEVAKVKVDEATKATQDGNGKIIADTYAEKATTLAGYGIGDAYTKTEIEALLTWGSF